MKERTIEDIFRGTALDEFTSRIIEKLLAAGFVIYRYDAYSTNSIYLKLDFGVCNSIRISDHEGKGYLKYRYNIGTHIKKRCTKQDKYPRNYYPVSEVEQMVKDIIADRDEKLKKYGKERYMHYMRENKTKHANDEGFWSKSRRIY